MAAPNATRAQVLVNLKLLIAANGYSPTVKELAAAVGIAPSTCYLHLSRLITEGRVTEEPGKARTLRVVEQEPTEVAG